MAATVPPVRALRTSEAVWVEYDSGERQFYTLRGDLYSLDNVAEEVDPGVVAQYALRS